jgi:hypothetical protein
MNTHELHSNASHQAENEILTSDWFGQFLESIMNFGGVTSHHLPFSTIITATLSLYYRNLI